MHLMLSRNVLALTVLLLLTGCLDKGGGGSKGSPSPEKKTPPVVVTANDPTVVTTDDRNGDGVTPTQSKKTLSPPSISVAQTHLIPASGLRWPDTRIKPELGLAAKRETLVTVRFDEGDILSPKLQVWSETELSTTLALNPPSQILPTEGGDPAPEENLWHTHIPAELVENGLSLSVVSDNYNDTETQPVLVGPETTVTFNILPVLLFGATEENTGKKYDEERILSFTEELMKEGAADLPWSHTVFTNHPAREFVSDFLVIAPRDGKEAFVAYSTSDIDSRAVVDTVNDIIRALHTPSGDEPLNRVTYGSILALDKNITSINKLAWIGRGVSILGSGTATSGNGGSKYGFLWHEGGHAVSLNHSHAESLDNWYPYIGGSIKGSAWSYNSYHKSFRSTLIPPTAPVFMSCRQIGNYQKNEEGRCYRQDPMDNADGGSAPSNRFPIFSDYNAARMQTWAQNRKKLDSTSPTKFSRWDIVTKTWIPHTPNTEQYGAWSINENLPVIFNEPVARINLTYSYAGTADASRFYPTLYSIENSIKIFDPLDRDSMDSIYPSKRPDGTTPKYMWYCHSGGCDYSVRVTFSDGSVVYRLLKGGFRKNSYPEEFHEEATDPLSSRSFKLWSTHVPRAADAVVTKLELLETPKAWSLSADEIINAKVLISESF